MKILTGVINSNFPFSLLVYIAPGDWINFKLFRASSEVKQSKKEKNEKNLCIQQIFIVIRSEEVQGYILYICYDYIRKRFINKKKKKKKNCKYHEYYVCMYIMMYTIFTKYYILNFYVCNSLLCFVTF